MRRPLQSPVLRAARSFLPRAATRVALAALASLPALAAPAAAQQAPAQPRGEVREVHFHTPALGAVKRMLVYLPPSYRADTTRRFPVAYYLHGAYGSESDWVRLGSLDVAMDSLVRAGMPELIVVMPDGDDGWYTTWNTLPNAALCRELLPEGQEEDTYCVGWPRYDDYVARDVVRHVDSTFRTLAAREHRGIGGLSMGGFGAVSLALQYPGVFSAAASHSGALAPLWRTRNSVGAGADSLPSMDEVRQAYGERLWARMRPAFGRDSAGWLARDPSRRAVALWRGDRERFPALFADVGRDDALLGQSRHFRDTIQGLGASITYHEWDGAHSWAYWTAHVPESLAWMAAQIAPR
ncbi:MAG: hypothetical protein GX537_09235 [Actinobacteria bacterium]|nr:hypothetical protein [Actinomycetota bacterium]